MVLHFQNLLPINLHKNFKFIGKLEKVSKNHKNGCNDSIVTFAARRQLRTVAANPFNGY